MKTNSSASKGVFICRRASPIGRASPLCRDPVSQLNSLTKFVFVYMRGGPAFSPRRAENVPYKRNLRGLTLLGGLASQSSVHMTKFVLASIF